MKGNTASPALCLNLLSCTEIQPRSTVDLERGCTVVPGWAAPGRVLGWGHRCPSVDAFCKPKQRESNTLHCGNQTIIWLRPAVAWKTACQMPLNVWWRPESSLCQSPLVPAVVNHWSERWSLCSRGTSVLEDDSLDCGKKMLTSP